MYNIVWIWKSHVDKVLITILQLIIIIMLLVCSTMQIYDHNKLFYIKT